MIARMSIPDPPLSRDRPIRRGSCALLIIDVQNATCDPAGPAAFRAAGVDRVVANTGQLLHAFRRARLEVVFTVMENLTADGRDRSLDYKLSGIFVARGSREAKVVAELAPADDELVLPKTSSSVFNSTMLDYLFRNIGITDVFVTGLLTDQCIDHAVKDGADRGYVHDVRARCMRCRNSGAAPGGAGLLQRVLPDADDADVLRLVAAAQ